MSGMREGNLSANDAKETLRVMGGSATEKNPQICTKKGRAILLLSPKYPILCDRP